MNNAQQEFLNKIEIAVAQLCFEGKNKEAKLLAAVADFLDKEESVMAYLEGEAGGLDPRVLAVMKNLFEIRW